MSTLTSILSTDIISASRSTINDNYNALNVSKAELDSPVFTGAPTLPTGTVAVTQSSGDNSTKVATTAFVDGALVSLTNVLHASSGSSTTTSANNLDSIAISGLTGLDNLVVYYNLQASTQNCGTNVLYHSTDGATIADVLNGNVLASGKMIAGSVLIKCSIAADPRNISAIFDGLNSTGITDNGATNTAMVNYIFNKTFSTAFNSSWTLALRNGGVTAGGTLYWSWQVFKIAGQ